MRIKEINLITEFHTKQIGLIWLLGFVLSFLHFLANFCDLLFHTIKKSIFLVFRLMNLHFPWEDRLKLKGNLKGKKEFKRQNIYSFFSKRIFYFRPMHCLFKFIFKTCLCSKEFFERSKVLHVEDNALNKTRL